MLTIRCTQRLLKAFRIKVIGEETPSTTRLGDWYANLIGTTCGNRILCVSDRSLLAVVLGEQPWNELPTSLGIAVSVVLERAGVPLDVIRRELAEMEKGRYAKTNSRVVLGVMNDFAYAVGLHLDGREDELAVSERLGRTPCSPIEYAFPIEVAKALLLGAAAG